MQAKPCTHSLNPHTSSYTVHTKKVVLKNELTVWPQSLLHTKLFNGRKLALAGESGG